MVYDGAITWSAPKVTNLMGMGAYADLDILLISLEIDMRNASMVLLADISYTRQCVM